jgi:hypothetical protein
MNQELFNKIGKYVVWFVVLLAVGYVLGIVFNAALFVLPGILLIIAVWYVLKNMSDKGIVQTIKTIMVEPVSWIKALAKALLPGLFK